MKIIILVLLMLAGCSSNIDNTINKGGNEMTNTIVVMETNMGNIEIELNTEKAPISSKNFIDYVNEGFYDGLIFHRVINNFMIQGGGFDKDMNEKETKAPIKNEAGNGLKNTLGTIAMARTQVIDSSSSQFFINIADNAFLDHTDDSMSGYGYAVFGKVISGMDTVDKIKSTQTGREKGFDDVPTEPIIIKKVYVK